VVSAGLGQIPWCFAYLEGCVSISKASREIPSQQIYRILIMTGACLMMLYWFLCGSWLKQLNGGESRGQLFVFIGLVSAVLLVINVALFADSEGVLKTVRRSCVAGFFILHMIAQLMFTAQLAKTVKQMSWPGLAQVVRTKFFICSAQLAFAVLVVIAPLFENRRFINNVVEWDFLLLMLCFYVVTASAWKQTAFRFSSFTTSSAQ
jgi:hypothetical protein